jgi:L-ribulose-5-phosphate 3-epimerase
MIGGEQVDRRDFLRTVGKTVAATGLVAGALGSRTSSALAVQTPSPVFKKSLKLGMVQGDMSILEKFKLLKEVGFDGVEPDAPSDKRDEIIAARDATGLVINGVVHATHWREPLSDPDPAVRRRGLEALRGALRDAKAFGATSVLLVPAVVKKEISYDDAYTRSQAEIRKALPLAEELGVAIAIENVWNNFLLSPLETARYIDELESPMMRMHFDVGNILRYGWPEQWIRILGKRIYKLDIKEYSLKKMRDEGVWKGFDVELLEGDCDWPEVMKALREIGYTGWGAAEVKGGGRERLEQLSRLMDRINAS